jgi:hypothetical protein
VVHGPGGAAAVLYRCLLLLPSACSLQLHLQQLLILQLHARALCGFCNAWSAVVGNSSWQLWVWRGWTAWCSTGNEFFRDAKSSERQERGPLPPITHERLLQSCDMSLSKRRQTGIQASRKTSFLNFSTLHILYCCLSVFAA